jgi:hypothetical protein
MENIKINEESLHYLINGHILDIGSPYKEIIEELQARIEELQRRIDIFNAVIDGCGFAIKRDDRNKWVLRGNGTIFIPEPEVTLQLCLPLTAHKKAVK